MGVLDDKCKERAMQALDQHLQHTYKNAPAFDPFRVLALLEIINGGSIRDVQMPREPGDKTSLSDYGRRDDDSNFRRNDDSILGIF